MGARKSWAPGEGPMTSGPRSFGMSRPHAWILGLILPACLSTSQDNPGSPPESETTDCAPDPTPLRRLTRAQIAQTLENALGVAIEAEASLPADGFVGPFAAGTNVSEPFIRSLADLAERAGDRYAENLPCSPGAACLTEVLTDLGPKLYRRPFTEAERTALREIQDAGAAAEGRFDRGVAWMVSAAIQAPDFLYIARPPGLAPDSASSQHLAARLAYFLWGLPPDAALLEAADDGSLAESDVLRAQAERMLADPRSRAVIERFVVGWLDLSRLSQVAKGERYLRFDTDARVAMHEETVRFADAIMRLGQGNLHTLLTARWSYVTTPLFPIYGMARPPNFDPKIPVSLLDGERYGILTHASVMTVHAAFDDSSPTARGSLILDNLVCRPIPLPNIDIPELPDPIPGQTNRERFEQHTSNAACASCHSIIDPIGFALESFDAVGAYRDRYANGQPVDNRGGLVSGDPDADGEAIGAKALSDRLLRSDSFQSCFVTQWMRLGLGRELTSNDDCIRDRLITEFRESNFDIRALILNLITSDAFRAGPEGA